MMTRIEINNEEKIEAIKDWIEKKYPELMSKSEIVGIYPSLGEITLKTRKDDES